MSKRDIDSMTADDLRALLHKQRADDRRRGQIYRQNKQEAGEIRFSVFIPSHRLGDVRRLINSFLKEPNDGQATS